MLKNKLKNKSKNKKLHSSLALLFTAFASTSSILIPTTYQHELPPLEKFIDALPVPQKIRFNGKGPHELTIKINQFQSKMHRDLPPVNQWGYNGMSPGPTIEVEQGQFLKVHWKNDLPSTHLFPSPQGMDMHMNGNLMTMLPDVRTVTHLHGAVVSQPDIQNRNLNSDGWPDAWVIPMNEQIAEYPNAQTARTLWYHDHAMGTTGRNVAAGLLGTYLIHDRYERSLNLPQGDYDIPLLLESKGLNDDGSLYYTDDIRTEFYGNAIAVNGKFWPYLEVQPRKYRFRIINASNARSYSMKLANASDQKDGPTFYQIASDSGFLEKTVVFNDPANPDGDRLTLAPAERAEIIVDFSNYVGQTLVLQNNSHDPGEFEAPLPELMQFRVTKNFVHDLSALPLQMKSIPRIDPASATQVRRIVLDTRKQNSGAPMLTLNGRSWSDPIEEKPLLGATEIWELTNTLTDIHPFHIHQVQFQVLDRRLFDVLHYLATGEILYLDDAVAPEENEMGWKDTVKVLPQMITRVIVRFGPFPGFYVYHCHILEHEDMDMMRPFQILQSPQP